jgi:glycosyltransferase involved in cell wall biosynthesis
VSGRTRTANLFGWDVGTGVSRHLQILSDILGEAGFASEIHPIPARARGDNLRVWMARNLPRRAVADLNVFTQDIVPSWLTKARVNVALPMQEWFDVRDLRLLPAIDVLVCHSQHAAEIFRPHHRRIEVIGFTSVDRRMTIPWETRDRIIHVAGRSEYKGAKLVLDVWRRHPEWPTLTLTHAVGLLEPAGLPNVDQRIGHIDDAELRQLQNEAWLHIQPSEAEGFGHCLCEALSCGAVVVSTDGPPMNELVRPGDGVLVPWAREEPLNMGFRYLATPEAVEETIARLLAEGRDTHRTLADRARERFEENDARNRLALSRLFSSL